MTNNKVKKKLVEAINISIIDLKKNSAHEVIEKKNSSNYPVHIPQKATKYNHLSHSDMTTIAANAFVKQNVAKTRNLFFLHFQFCFITISLHSTHNLAKHIHFYLYFDFSIQIYSLVRPLHLRRLIK